MMKILNYILRSYSLGTHWILIPILHPHTGILSTAASSKQFNIISLRVSVLGKIVWFVHSLTTRSRQVDPTSPYLIFPPNKKDMQLMESINIWQGSKHQKKNIQYKDFTKITYCFSYSSSVLLIILQLVLPYLKSDIQSSHLQKKWGKEELIALEEDSCFWKVFIVGFLQIVGSSTANKIRLNW